MSIKTVAAVTIGPLVALGLLLIGKAEAKAVGRWRGLRVAQLGRPRRRLILYRDMPALGPKPRY